MSDQSDQSDMAPATVTVTGVDAIPEVHESDDLAALVHQHAPVLATGDIVVVTSKVVSKAEGRVVADNREAAIVRETQRVVARRGPTTIARTSHGLTLAAAGVDASNTTSGTVVLLPKDPDRSARRLRVRIRELSGVNVAVVVSDTAGRAWRLGQSDIAIGCAGLDPLHDHAGLPDSHGNPLSVTAPAVADEIAGMADLVMGKLARRPVALVRGLGHLVLPADLDGPGASALIRPDEEDMFALGTREAVRAAVCREHADTEHPEDLAHPPAGWALAGEPPAPVEQLVRQASAGTATLVVRRTDSTHAEVSGDDDFPTAAALERLSALAVNHGWQRVADDRNAGRCRIVLRTSRRGS